MENLQELAKKLVSQVQSIDEKIVDLSGFHAERHTEDDRIGDDKYYLAHGSVWCDGSYVLRFDGTAFVLYRDSPGEVRRLIAACLSILATLTEILPDVAEQAGRNEQAARELVK